MQSSVSVVVRAVKDGFVRDSVASLVKSLHPIVALHDSTHYTI